jgi:hypothetical protein
VLIRPVVSGNDKLYIEISLAGVLTTSALINKIVEVLDKSYDFITDLSTTTYVDFSTITAGQITIANATTDIVGGTIITTDKGIGLVDNTGISTNDKKLMLKSVTLSPGGAIEENTRNFLLALNSNNNDPLYGYYISTIDGIPGNFVLESDTFENDSFTFDTNKVELKSDFSFSLEQESEREVNQHRIYWSKYKEGDAVPLFNFLDIGNKNSPIQRIVALKDYLIIFKTDGVFRLSGDSDNTFSYSLIDNTNVLVAVDSPSVLNDQVYYLSKGKIGYISESAFSNISISIQNLIQDISRIPNYKTKSFGLGYTSDNAYLLFVPDETLNISRCFRFSTVTNTWTTWNKSFNCGILNTSEDKLYFGSDQDNFVEVERKELKRTDFADREYSDKSITKVENTVISLNNKNLLEVGDVFLQNQYLTINYLNRIIRKLNGDTNLNSNLAEIINGADLQNEVSIIAAMLDSNDSSLLPSTSASTSVGTTITLTNSSYSSGMYVKILTDGTAVNPALFIGNVLKINSDINANDKTLVDIYTGSPVLSYSGVVVINLEQCYPYKANLSQEDLRFVFNLLINTLNSSAGIQASNYELSEGINTTEAWVEKVDSIGKKATIDKPTPFVKGQIVHIKSYESIVEYQPTSFGEAAALKHVREGRVYFHDTVLKGGKIGYSSDISGAFEEMSFAMERPSDFGMSEFGSTSFGGAGQKYPVRTLIPRIKQRCRLISARLVHKNARDGYALYGIAYVLEITSDKGYRK